MNEILGTGIDDEHQLVFLVTTAQKLTEVDSLRDQARNNSREQFKNAGDVAAIGEEMLVLAKDELAEKSDRQNAAIQESMTRLFSDKEGLARLMSGLTDYSMIFTTKSKLNWPHLADPALRSQISLAHASHCASSAAASGSLFLFIGQL